MSKGTPAYNEVHVPVGLTDAEVGDDWRLRRADLLQRIMDAGGWAMLNISELARTYDVDRSTLYSDKEALAEYVDGELGGHETLDGEALYGRAVRDLLEDAEALRSQGDRQAAAKVTKEAARVFTWQSEWRKAEGLEQIEERLDALEEELEESTPGFGR